MLRGYRLAIIALGLTLFAGGMGLQAQPVPQEKPVTIKSEPVTEAQQADPAPSTDYSASDYSQLIERITSELVGIKGAIRDLQAEENAADRAADKEGKKRDLDAQEAMAFWAKWMFWATVCTVIVGIGGIVYVRLALLETRRLGQTEIRAYLTITDMTVQIDDLQPPAKMFAPSFKFKVRNTGNSPARNIRYYIRGAYLYRGCKGEVRGSTDFRKNSATFDVAPNVAIPREHTSLLLLLNNADRAALDSGTLRMAITAYVSFLDVFDKEHTADFNFFAELGPLALEGGVEARVTGDTAEHMARLFSDSHRTAQTQERKRRGLRLPGGEDDNPETNNGGTD